MSLFRREIEGVCADLLGPRRARKRRGQSRPEASRIWAEGGAKRRPAQLRSSPYIRSSRSRRRRSWRAVRPAHSGRPPRLARRAGPGRHDPQAGQALKKSHARCPPRRHARERHALDAARQAHDRHGPWPRPTRIERRSRSSPLQLTAKLFRSKSCSGATI